MTGVQGDLERVVTGSGVRRRNHMLAGITRNQGEVSDMNIKNKAAGVAAVLSLTGAVIGIGSIGVQPASAAVISGWHSEDTSGAKAECRIGTTDSGTRNAYAWIQCWLWDTGADGDSVYVAWDTDNYPGERSLYNKNGSSQPPAYLTNTKYVESGHMIKWKVCRDRGFPFTDNCSAYVTYYF